MKKYLILVFISILSGCSSSYETKEFKENPCQDVIYQKLKKIKVSEMTGSEREYFNMKDKECREFSDYRKELKRDEKLATLNLILILGTIGLLTIATLILMTGEWH